MKEESSCLGTILKRIILGLIILVLCSVIVLFPGLLINFAIYNIVADDSDGMSQIIAISELIGYSLYNIIIVAEILLTRYENNKAAFVFLILIIGAL